MQAVAQALLSSGRRSDEIRFVGSRRGQEAELLAGSPIELVLLSGRGVKRSLTLRSTWSNVHAILALAYGVVRATSLLLTWKPAAVVSVGGYASLPMDAAAVLTRTPLVLIDLDAVSSGTHRLFRRFASRRCVAYPDDDPRAIVTGAPLRQEIRNVVRSTSPASDDESRRWTIVVMTGSLGANRVNVAVSELAQNWRARTDLRIIHVTGRRDFDEMKARSSLSELDALHYELLAFGDMATLWAQADLAVCRAGATTVAELTYLAIPSILIPLPGAPNDHQTRNARSVVDVGGAVLISDSQLTSDLLGQQIDALICDPQRIDALSNGARRLRHDDSSGEIAAVINGLVT